MGMGIFLCALRVLLFNSSFLLRKVSENVQFCGS